MKNKMIYALGAMMLVGVTSCDLTEKPSSFYEKDTYFVTEGKAQMAVVGIYDCLETTDYYGQNIMPFFGSDDMFMVRGTGSDGTRRDISHFTTRFQICFCIIQIFDDLVINQLTVGTRFGCISKTIRIFRAERYITKEFH